MNSFVGPGLQGLQTSLMCLQLPLGSFAMGVSSYCLARISAVGPMGIAGFAIGTFVGVASLGVVLFTMLAAWVGDPVFRRLNRVALLAAAALAGLSASLVTAAFYGAPASAARWWASLSREQQADFLFRNNCPSVDACQTAIVRYLQQLISTEMAIMWMLFATLALGWLAEIYSLLTAPKRRDGDAQPPLNTYAPLPDTSDPHAVVPRQDGIAEPAPPPDHWTSQAQPPRRGRQKTQVGPWTTVGTGRRPSLQGVGILDDPLNSAAVPAMAPAQASNPFLVPPQPQQPGGGDWNDMQARMSSGYAYSQAQAPYSPAQAPYPASPASLPPQPAPVRYSIPLNPPADAPPTPTEPLPSSAPAFLASTEPLPTPTPAFLSSPAPASLASPTPSTFSADPLSPPPPEGRKTPLPRRMVRSGVSPSIGPRTSVGTGELGSPLSLGSPVEEGGRPWKGKEVVTRAPESPFADPPAADPWAAQQVAAPPDAWSPAPDPEAMPGTPGQGVVWEGGGKGSPSEQSGVAWGEV